MLVKILSKKIFFVQILLGIAFLVLFFIQHFTQIVDWQSIIGVLSYLLTSGVLCVFFIHSKLVKPTSIPFWFLLIWLLTFSDLALDYRLSLSFLFSTLLFWRFLVAQDQPETKNSIFEIGVLLSVSSFFYPPSIFLSGLILLNYFYIQSFNFRAILLFIIGLFIPMVIGLELTYLIGDTEWIENYKSQFCLSLWSSGFWFLIPIGFLIVLSWIDHLTHSNVQDIHKRQLYFLTFLYFINYLIIIVLFSGGNPNTLAFLGLPLTVFLTRFTQYQSIFKVRELLLWFYLGVMLLYYFQKEVLEIYQDLLGNISF
ncbi:MAG: DUF6427 family protein [Moheibacter sp.]